MKKRYLIVNMSQLINENYLEKANNCETAETINSIFEKFIERPRIALIADVPNWAFHNISKQIIKHLGGAYEFEIFFHGDYPEIENLMLDVKDFDLIHFFWRDALFSLLSEHVRHSFDVKGWDYFDFIVNVVATANTTTSIYDHLLLSEYQVQERSVLFNALTIGYTTCSERLNKIYSSFPKYAKPFGNIEDGIDLEIFRPTNLERLYDENREIVIGWVGNSKWGGDGIDHKGLETIIKPAIQSLREEGYNVRGYYADRMERWIPHNEMNEYYNSIDIYVCASDIEGTPNPALESMACGIPIVSTDVGIIPDLFGPLQKEYVMTTRSVEDLIIKLKKLAGDPQKRREISDENLTEIKKWSWKNQCQKFDNFFRAMLFVSQEKHIKERRDLMRRQILENYITSNPIQIAENEPNKSSLEIVSEDINLSIQYDELKEFTKQLQLKISLMEQSKFWKVRQEWFKIKRKVGLSKNKY